MTSGVTWDWSRLITAKRQSAASGNRLTRTTCKNSLPSILNANTSPKTWPISPCHHTDSQPNEVFFFFLFLFFFFLSSFKITRMHPFTITFNHDLISWDNSGKIYFLYFLSFFSLFLIISWLRIFARNIFI